MMHGQPNMKKSSGFFFSIRNPEFHLWYRTNFEGESAC